MTDTAAVDTSLKGRLARRREELRRAQIIDLPVPGYEKDLVARYVPLDYHVLRRIGQRSEDTPDKIQAEIDLAIDTLVNANEGIYEKTPNGLVSTGYSWKQATKAATELFGVAETELSPKPTAREAILLVFPNDTAAVTHYAQYSQKASYAQETVEDQIAGESGASSPES